MSGEKVSLSARLVRRFVHHRAIAPLAAELEVVPAAIDGERVGDFRSFVRVERHVAGADAGERGDVDVGQTFFARRESAVAVAGHAHIQSEIAMGKVGVGLIGHLVRANAVVADAKIVQHARTDHPRVADADVLRAELRGELIHSQQRVVQPARRHDHIPAENAMVVVEAVIDAGQILVGVEFLIVGADVVQRGCRRRAPARRSWAAA